MSSIRKKKMLFIKISFIRDVFRQKKKKIVLKSFIIWSAQILIKPEGGSRIPTGPWAAELSPEAASGSLGF